MDYIDEEMFDAQTSFDFEDVSFDDESFDEPDLDELDLMGEHVCSRCGAEFDSADELEHISKHGVCQSCLSVLILETAEDAMGL